MRITKGGQELITNDGSRLELRYLKPGDVFRYARGNENNVYQVCHSGYSLCLSNSRIYPNNSPESMVIWYPDAELMLGDTEVSEPCEDRSREWEPPMDMDEREYYNDYPLNWDY